MSGRKSGSPGSLISVQFSLRSSFLVSLSSSTFFSLSRLFHIQRSSSMVFSRQLIKQKKGKCPSAHAQLEKLKSLAAVGKCYFLRWEQDDGEKRAEEGRNYSILYILFFFIFCNFCTTCQESVTDSWKRKLVSICINVFFFLVSSRFSWFHLKSKCYFLSYFYSLFMYFCTFCLAFDDLTHLMQTTF